MRISDFSQQDKIINEAIPVVPTIGTTGIQPTATTGIAATGQPNVADAQANAARAAQDRQKSIQDLQAEIRNTEQHLIALRKQLAEIRR